MFIVNEPTGSGLTTNLSKPSDNLLTTYILAFGKTVVDVVTGALVVVVAGATVVAGTCVVAQEPLIVGKADTVDGLETYLDPTTI